MNVFDLVATITLNSDGYKRGLEDAKSDTEQAANQIGVKTVAIGNLVAKAVEKGGEYLGRLARTGIEYNAQIESYTASLTTALGNEAAAAAAIEQIKADAARTPYSVDGLVKANSYLIAAGESAEGSRQTILALTDAISATGGGNAELMRMAQNLQQIKNTGKATSMDIRQFAMAGIDVFGILADYMGITAGEVQELDISYEMLAGALEKAASEGGRYFQANARQAATLNGQISTLKDNVSQALGRAFEGLSNTIRTKALPAANEFVTSFDFSKIERGFAALVPVIGTIGAALAAQKVADTIVGWTAAISKAVTAAGSLSAALTSAFPVALVAAAVASIVFAVKNVSDAYKDARIDVEALKASLADSTPPETIARVGELAGEYNKLSDQLISTKSELDNLRAAGIDDATDREYQAKINALNEQMKGLKRTISELTETASEVPDAIGDSVDGLAEQTAELDKQWDDLTKRYVETYNDISKNVNKWFGLFDEAKVNVRTSIEDMMSSMQSQIDFNATYSANLEKIRSYDLPQVAAAFQSMGAEGSAYAAELVAAVEAAGGSTSEAGQQIIQDFNALSEGVASSREKLTESLTNVTGEFESAFEGLVESTKASVDEMNMSAEAGASGAATVQAYIAAIAAGAGPAYGAAASVAASAAAGFGAAGGSGAGSSGRSGGNGRGFARLAVGSDYIPYDDYPALLHKGEMVVPAKISADLRDFLGAGKQAGSGSAGGGMGEVVSLLRAILAKDSNTYLDGEIVSRRLAPSTNRALGNVDMLGGRGLSMA